MTAPVTAPVTDPVTSAPVDIAAAAVTPEASAGVTAEVPCEVHKVAHDRRVCAVHQALAESAGIYDLDDDEAAHFVRVFESLTGPVVPVEEAARDALGEVKSHWDMMERLGFESGVRALQMRLASPNSNGTSDRG